MRWMTRLLIVIVLLLTGLSAGVVPAMAHSPCLINVHVAGIEQHIGCV